MTITPLSNLLQHCQRPPRRFPKIGYPQPGSFRASARQGKRPRVDRESNGSVRPVALLASFRAIRSARTAKAEGTVIEPAGQDCDSSWRSFLPNSLANPQLFRAPETDSKAILPGTVSSTSVPAAARLSTRSLPQILSARSFMPNSPQCPSRPDSRTCWSIPRPLSRTRTRR